MSLARPKIRGVLCFHLALLVMALHTPATGIGEAQRWAAPQPESAHADQGDG
jgi:hypothetical protein